MSAARPSARVIGNPIAHSLSPAIFSFIAHELQVPFEYEAEQVLPVDLAACVMRLRNSSDEVGMNVTLPHKEQIIRYLDLISDDAQAIGAVNVVQNQNGILVGYNTDVIGIERTLEQFRVNVFEKDYLIFGAGGAAKALAWVLGQKLAGSVVLVSENVERGQSVVQQFRELFPKTRFTHESSIQKCATEFALVANCTPAGLKGIEYSSVFEGLENLKHCAGVAFDMIYYPEQTLFIERLSRQGFRTISGMNMLVDQALASFEIWLGKNPRLSSIRAELFQFLNALMSARENPKPLFLTGFMGAGKSTAAKLLAKLTQRHWVDTDLEIEKSSGLSIDAFFKSKGEAEFREEERRVVEKTILMPGTIVALGGGTLLNPENLEGIKRAGTLIHLDVDAGTVQERIGLGATTRPLLAGLSLDHQRARIEELLKSRGPLYEQAHFQISTLNRTPLKVVHAILNEISNRSQSS